jgi:thiol-disulfide isomerase/thioredoxin/tetratricopeptide (TPR) repeat protein
MGFSACRAVIAAIVMSAAAAGVAAAAPPTGRPAPPFTLTTVDGKTVDLAGFHGKTLVINVWGSWCPPCRLETPDLIAEAAAMHGSGVAFLGVDTTETPAVVRAFAAAKGVPYPQIVTTGDSAFAHDYDITNYPTTIVIDPNGILRAIHADNILPRAQLHAYIVAAQHGQTAPLMSAEQQKLDAMLDPAKFPFDGDPETALASARAADKAIYAADNELDDAMIDPARDHDLLRTRDEQDALRLRAIAALQAHAVSPEDRALLARMQGYAAQSAGRYAESATAFRAALAIGPQDVEALSGLLFALERSGDHAAALPIAAQIASLSPSYSSEIALARARAAVGDHDDTIAAIDAAIPLAAQKSPAVLAWTHLYAGRAAVTVHDPARAKQEFAAAGTAAERVPRTNPRYSWYLEQSQEALIALGLSGTGSAATVTMAPWTGPDLPGSIASTYKYRVALSGPPGQAVKLHASGLPKDWVASFCTNRVCAPFTVESTIPASGVLVIEFQVIPDVPGSKAHPTVRIDATAGGEKSATSAVVA